MVGLVVAYLDNYFYPEVLEKLSKALQQKGYHVLIFMAEQTAKILIMWLKKFWNIRLMPLLRPLLRFPLSWLTDVSLPAFPCCPVQQSSRTFNIFICDNR